MVTIEISVKDEKGVEIKSSSFPELETGLSERGIEENKFNHSGLQSQRLTFGMNA